MSNYRSHTQVQVTAALLRGEEVWALDTANQGDDDHLVGEYTEVLSDVLYHHELESELPADWSLNRVSTPDYVEVLVSTVYCRSIGTTGCQRHVAYLPEDTSLSIPPIRVLPEIGELRLIEMIEKSADCDEGGPLDLVLAQLWTQEAFIADQCEKMNGHHDAVYAAFGQG